MDTSSPLPAFDLNEPYFSPDDDQPLNPPLLAIDLNEPYFSPDDDQPLIPAETEATAAEADNPAKIPEVVGLPQGFRFAPSEAELILYYLQPQSIKSPSAQEGIITSLDVYCYEPHQLQGKAVDYGDGKMYFYTNVKKLGKGKTERGIRSGLKTPYHWKLNENHKPILDSAGNTVGFKASLAYYTSKKVKTQWLMHEYRLKNHTSGDPKKELVLAVIYYRETRGEDGEEDS